MRGKLFSARKMKKEKKKKSTHGRLGKHKTHQSNYDSSVVKSDNVVNIICYKCLH